MPPDRRDAARSALQRTIGEANREVRQALSEIENSPGIGLVEQPLPWPARGALRIEAEADSVQLFVLRYGR